MGITPDRLTLVPRGIRPCAWLGLALLVAFPGRASAQTAQNLYERALSQERAALSAPEPAPDALRKVAKLYEAVVLEYPTSGYADNALWQAAGLLQRTFEISGEAKDRDAAGRFLAWLKREYPHSGFAKQSLPKAPPAVASPVATPTGTAAAGAQAVASLPPRTSGRPSVTIRNVTQSSIPRGDRVTIELSEEVAFTGERVANPDRIFFDFANSAIAGSVAERARTVKSPLIKAVRLGSPASGVTRVVLELTGAPRFSSFPLYGPFRLVIDVEAEAPPAGAPPSTPSTNFGGSGCGQRRCRTPPSPRTQSPPQDPPAVEKPAPAVTSPAATSPPPPPPAPPSSTRSGDYSLARQLGLRVARVVIDPGHGGHDPGAQANGITEAELVLDVALRLEKLLQQVPGLEVVLTRRTNEFVPLEERTAIANREHADLFLSIHANAHKQTGVRGIETYFLNFASNPEAEAVAARENATSLQTMGTLPAIVKAIALNNKIAESKEFATLLQTQLVKRMKTQSAATRDHGVKQAPFVVLIGAQMPSVLTEIAFVTNRPEAGLLKQNPYRQNIAQALKDAVVRYQDSLKNVATVASREGASRDR
jgi:N-acetylmuramoyl-L-alanine amidase